MSERSEQLRQQILQLTAEFHAEAFAAREFVPGSSITGDFIVRSLLSQHATIMEWKSHLYVLHGAVYNEVLDYSGAREFTVVKLFLSDPRFFDEHREVVFNGETDDLAKVQGMLEVTIKVPPSPWK